MTPQEFQQLRDLSGKVVSANIEFKLVKDTRPNLTFEQIDVQNDLGWPVVLNGTYKPDVPSVTFNFCIRRVGAICRVDVNGAIHHPAGRTHKHDLQKEDDPRNNLPFAVARPDLAGKSAREIWEAICLQAKIQHTGIFIDP